VTIQAVALPTKSPGNPVALASAPAAQPAPAPEAYQAPTIETPNVASVEPAKKKAVPPAGPIVTLAISPWGEVYVDGEKRGVSPPLRTVKVTPGRHKIEIRNAGLPSHTETIDAKSDSKITIKHRFK
jgi:hypothetical protein